MEEEEINKLAVLDLELNVNRKKKDGIQRVHYKKKLSSTNLCGSTSCLSLFYLRYGHFHFPSLCLIQNQVLQSLDSSILLLIYLRINLNYVTYFQEIPIVIHMVRLVTLNRRPQLVDIIITVLIPLIIISKQDPNNQSDGPDNRLVLFQ